MSTGYENPTVIFDSGCVVEIPENSTLIFSGIGKVVFSDGVVIRLLATENTKSKSITNKASLIFKDGVVLDFASGANSSISGIGNIILQNASAIKPSVSGSLAIGASNSDEISINVSGNSQICLEAPYITGVARISLSKLNASLIFEQGGQLIIGANGVFELNTLNGQPSRGVITELSFKNNGLFAIKDNGNFVLSQNRLQGGSQNNYDLSWSGVLARIVGGGYLVYNDVKAAKSFTGKVFALDQSLFTDIPEITLDQLALMLVSKMPEILKTSTLFERPDGIEAVMTNKNVIKVLLAGDVVEGDDSDGTIYGTDAKGDDFSISADGIRD